MMTRLCLSAALAVCLLVLSACNVMDAGEAAGNPDEFFLVGAAHANQAEITASRVALDRSQNPQVRQFAQHMIDEHSNASRDLNQLARDLDIDLPNRPDELHAKLNDHLLELEGEQFDRQYISAMESDHAAMLTAFRNQALAAQNALVRSWAQEQVPVLEDHLRRTQALRQSLLGGGASGLMLEVGPAGAATGTGSGAGTGTRTDTGHNTGSGTNTGTGTGAGSTSPTPAGR